MNFDDNFCDDFFNDPPSSSETESEDSMDEFFKPPPVKKRGRRPWKHLIEKDEVKNEDDNNEGQGGDGMSNSRLNKSGRPLRSAARGSKSLAESKDSQNSYKTLRNLLDPQKTSNESLRNLKNLNRPSVEPKTLPGSSKNPTNNRAGSTTHPTTSSNPTGSSNELSSTSSTQKDIKKPTKLKPLADQVQCTFCPKYLSTTKWLNLHVLKFHNENNKYKCDKCSHGHCKTHKNLASHLRLHDELKVDFDEFHKKGELEKLILY